MNCISAIPCCWQVLYMFVYDDHTMTIWSKQVSLISSLKKMAFNVTLATAKMEWILFTLNLIISKEVLYLYTINYMYNSIRELLAWANESKTNSPSCNWSWKYHQMT